MNRYGNSFLSSIPPVVMNLIIINLILWLGSITLVRFAEIDLNSVLGLHFWASQKFRAWQLISYMFMHASQFNHLFFNMFALFMFGRVLEDYWGSKRFLTYYMVTGIGAGLVQLLVLFFQISYLQSSLPAEVVGRVYEEGANLLAQNYNYSNELLAKLNASLNTVTVGASGSVFGLLLAFGMMFPHQPLYLMFIPVPIKAKYFVIGYAVIELFFGVANFRFDNIAHFAHLGGMLFGYLLILYWRKKQFRTW